MAYHAKPKDGSDSVATTSIFFPSRMLALHEQGTRQVLKSLSRTHVTASVCVSPPGEGARLDCSRTSLEGHNGIGQGWTASTTGCTHPRGFVACTLYFWPVSSLPAHSHTRRTCTRHELKTHGGKRGLGPLQQHTRTWACAPCIGRLAQATWSM